MFAGIVLGVAVTAVIAVLFNRSKITGYPAAAKTKNDLLAPSQGLTRILDNALLGYWQWQCELDRLAVSDVWLAQLGLDSSCLNGCFEDWVSLVHPIDLKNVQRALNNTLKNDTPYRAEFRMRHKQGYWVWISATGLVTERNEDNNAICICGTHQLITEQKRLEQALIERNSVLEKIARGDSQQQILDDLVHYVEELLINVKGSILLVSNDRLSLNNGSAPQLPAFYCEAIEGLPIAHGVGSCGSAAHSGQRVIVEDVSTHPYWASFASLAKQAGLASCWSEPVIGLGNSVIATLAVYSDHPRAPDAEELMLLKEVAQVVGNAIERSRSKEKLLQSSAVFNNTPEGMIITDSDCKIIATNRSFSVITGFSEAEMIGCKPSMRKSGLHNADFYSAMWKQLNNQGVWRGEIWNKRKDGSIYPEWLSISRVDDEEGNVCNFVSSFSDITSLKDTDRRFQYMAHHDSLTGLPNRDLLNIRLDEAIAQAEAIGGQLAVLFVDLDNFKNVNDSLGHQVGDRVLSLFAERLSVFQSDKNTVARLGGDEFAIVMGDINSAQQAVTMAENILEEVKPEFVFDHHAFSLGASLGISIYPADGLQPVELLRNADAAMYQAKSSGRNQYYRYNRSLNDKAYQRMRLESDLRKSLGAGHFHVYYQPKIDMRNGDLRGAEALVRWQHPERGLVSPATFIPLAEETGLVLPLGKEVLETACRDMVSWKKSGVIIDRISVNLAGEQLQHRDIVKTITEVLRETGCQPQWLELEVTENFIMCDAKGAIDKLLLLKAMGIRLSIDDFGTGYSSLSYLKQLPIDVLKIDQSFVQGVPGDGNDCAIIHAILALAKSLGLDLIAEGVETEQQRDFLIDLDCTDAQGYLYSAPLPRESFERNYLAG